MIITSTKLYVPAVTLSINNGITFLENIKQGFKSTISWNKYRSKITGQPKNNNLNYMIQHLRMLKGCLFFHIIKCCFSHFIKTQNFLGKDLKDQFIGLNIKHKVKRKMR